MNKSRITVLAASLGFAVSTLVGCGGSNDPTAAPPPSPSPSATPADDKYACTLVRMAFRSSELTATDLHHAADKANSKELQTSIRNMVNAGEATDIDIAVLLSECAASGVDLSDTFAS